MNATDAGFKVGQQVNIRGIGTVQIMEVHAYHLDVNFKGEGWPTVRVEISEVTPETDPRYKSAREYAEIIMRRAIAGNCEWFIYERPVDGGRTNNATLPPGYLGRYVRFEGSGRITTMIGPKEDVVNMDGAAKFLTEKMGGSR